MKKYKLKKQNCKKNILSLKRKIKNTKENSKLDLLEYINKNCSFVGKKEQVEIDFIIKNFNQENMEFFSMEISDILEN